MAVVIKDRFVLPLGKGLCRELVYLTNVANDDTYKPRFAKIHALMITVVNWPSGAYTTATSADFAASGGRDQVTIRDPQGGAGTIYELDIIGQ